MESLDHEKFNSLKELSEIQAKIAEGRALLASLEEHKEDFLANRAKELALRINQALHDSREYIAEINQHNDELVKYRRQCDDYIESLRYFSEFVMGISNSLRGDVEVFHRFLDDTGIKIKESREEVKRGISQVKDGQRALDIREETLRKEEKLLKDGQETLKRAIERLKQNRI